MTLEATIICVDNSEYSRNGDFSPSRLESQGDSLNILGGSKLAQNAESSVGVMTYAGRPQVLETLTTDVTRIMQVASSLKVLPSEPNLLQGVQVAALALKHRANKNQRQRIILFVASPLQCTESELVKLAKRLKKTNVSVDVINFGEETENQGKLETFISTVNNKDGTSHLVTVPPGPHILSDVLISSPIINNGDDGGAGGGGGGMGGGGGGFEFGVDPSMDPELALALRVSLEEDRARQEALSKATAESTAPTTEEGGVPATPANAASTAPTSTPGAPGKAAMDTTEDTPAPAAAATAADADEMEMLRQALAMSMAAPAPDTPAPAATAAHSGELTEEEELAMALQMSMQAQAMDTTEDSAAKDKAPETVNDEFLQSVLGSLPGVNPDDERFKGVLGDKKKDDEGDKKA